MSLPTDPIAVFDSGIGGISVLRHLLTLLPHENYIYLGDSANAPYGEKRVSEVRELTFSRVEELLGKGAKAVVIACNTATSAAASELRAAYPDTVIVGIEPALKPAAAWQSGATVLVMATPMTLREEKFLLLRQKWSGDARVIELPCYGLAEMIEQGITEGPELEAYLDRVFREVPRQKVTAVVLGCTHYPHVRSAIAAYFEPSVRIFDGGEGTARETCRRLQEASLLNPGQSPGRVEIINTGSPELAELCYRLLRENENAASNSLP